MLTAERKHSATFSSEGLYSFPGKSSVSVPRHKRLFQETAFPVLIGSPYGPVYVIKALYPYQAPALPVVPFSGLISNWSSSLFN